MTIKKVYAELIELLETNRSKKVSTILDQVYNLASTKQSSKNFKVDDTGKVTHIYCYYHREWEALDEVEYGTKKHSASGYNSMCKQGVNQWSKQQREAKKAENALLDRLSSGELDPSQLQEEREKIEQERTKIVPREQ